MKNASEKTYHFLRSGKWEGFYCYYNSRKQHKMSIQLYFDNCSVSGSEIDNENTCKWNGIYNIEHFEINMIKTDQTDIIKKYKGNIDENGILGTWEQLVDLSVFATSKPKLFQQLKEMSQGVFHIWPKALNSEPTSKVKESKKLKELYITSKTRFTSVLKKQYNKK